MAIATRLLGSGIAPAAAQNIVGDAELAATATGSTITDAYQMYAAVTNFTTVASSTGAIVPPMNPGDSVLIYNGGAQTLTVYPTVGATINNGASSLSVAANKGVLIFKKSATTFASVLTA
jgi:hypothetical protein